MSRNNAIKEPGARSALEHDDNPFKAAIHAGFQTYYVTADDRINAITRFNRAQCEAALRMVDLQKMVANAVRRRLGHLDKVCTVIHFTDHGQDFLRWELDAKGKVIGCEPFQGTVWIGNRVLHHEKLRAGGTVHFVIKSDSSSHNIRYPIARVERVKGGAT